MRAPEEILKEYWGYDAFRPLQKEIIQSILEEKDTLAILPTGGGKSICFQVPALCTEGLCLVVSPLIALMKDQVENLKKRSIPALLIHSGMSRADVIQTLRNATQDYFKFLYISPERLETSLFREYLPALNVSLVAIDEAHCISQWGYDFRPSYLRIAALRKELPRVPVLALTASATPEVQADICTQLEMKNPVVFKKSFSRKNLSYSAFPVDSKMPRLIEIVSKVKGTAIVYCRSRKRTVDVANLLQLQGIDASFYHAGLSPDERNRRQQDWITGKVRVICCTNAFGMGIDKPDVRLVIHADVPDCLENYYQEAGRAGRDEQKAYTVLLHDQRDLEELAQLHLTRYPTLEKIREVYNALVNFLQIPVHTGQDRSFAFRFDQFVRNFKLESAEALYALKALESDGWLDFNEKSFAPSTLVFQTSKPGLYEFQKSYPQHEALLTTLLRTYEGIFDYPAFISELNLSKLLRMEEEDLKQQLRSIAGFGIIRYTPQSNEPQIIFRKNRVSMEDFSFNLMPYYKRRDNFIARTKAMINYVKEEQCRSVAISSYFGEENPEACGVCDNCLKKKNGVLNKEEFDRISSIILKQLNQGPLSAEEIAALINGTGKEKAWKVIQFLQAEKKIVMNEGMLRIYP